MPCIYLSKPVFVTNVELQNPQLIPNPQTKTPCFNYAFIDQARQVQNQKIQNLARIHRPS